jgi:hypothetical protein
MRKLIAWVFMHSLGSLLAGEGTEYWEFWFGLPVDPAATKQNLDAYQSAHARLQRAFRWCWSHPRSHARCWTVSRSP